MEQSEKCSSPQSTQQNKIQLMQNNNCRHFQRGGFLIVKLQAHVKIIANHLFLFFKNFVFIKYHRKIKKTLDKLTIISHNIANDN